MSEEGFVPQYYWKVSMPSPVFLDNKGVQLAQNRLMVLVIHIVELKRIPVPQSPEPFRLSRIHRETREVKIARFGE